MGMKRFHYEAADRDGQTMEFSVVEQSESIANAEAMHEVRKRMNPVSLTAFNLVCVEAYHG